MRRVFCHLKVKTELAAKKKSQALSRLDSCYMEGATPSNGMAPTRYCASSNVAETGTVLNLTKSIKFSIPCLKFMRFLLTGLPFQ